MPRTESSDRSHSVYYCLFCPMISRCNALSMLRMFNRLNSWIATSETDRDLFKMCTLTYTYMQHTHTYVHLISLPLHNPDSERRVRSPMTAGYVATIWTQNKGHPKQNPMWKAWKCQHVEKLLIPSSFVIIYINKTIIIYESQYLTFKTSNTSSSMWARFTCIHVTDCVCVCLCV